MTKNQYNVFKLCIRVLTYSVCLGCFQHKLHLIWLDAVAAVDGPLTKVCSEICVFRFIYLNFQRKFLIYSLKVKNVVAYFNASSNATEELLTEQDDEDNALMLISEVRTRWNSAYLMIKRYIKLHVAASSVLLKVRNQFSSII